MEQKNFMSWGEFEEFTRDILENFDFLVEFRKVFEFRGRKYEIDVVGHRKDLILCLDCKLYKKGKSRVSALKRQARIHYERTKALEKLEGKRCIPIVVTFLDDSLLFEENCIFVPVEKLNDFLNNLDFYLEELNVL